MLREPNVVYVGTKSVMSYVFAVITSFSTTDTKEVTLKARGRAITTAVDVAEITRRRFMDKVKVSDIKIGTEELNSEKGGKRAVSTIEIILSLE
ncbi:MAG: DNA-binding protein Alba [Candidatus Bathyarchaeia archaeon]